MRYEANRRPHTGRRRNDAARQAILSSAAELIGETDYQAVTVDGIARAAGVSKQTIYRWWPSKSAVLLDAVVERARVETPAPHTGTLAGDLTSFLAATFETAGTSANASLLRTVMAEAQRDPHAGESFAEFTATRRAALRDILQRGQTNAELPSGADLELMIDQVYGVLWYRVLVAHAPLDRALATQLTAALLGQPG